MKNNFFHSHKRGSMTVEASIIVPTMIISLILVIYICLFLYQQTYLQSVANSAAERGASTWNNMSKDMYIEYIDKNEIENTSLYWRLPEAFSSDDKKKKLERVTGFVESNVSKYSLFDKKNGAMNSEYNYRNLSVDCSISDYIIYKKLEVKVSEEYKIPFKNLLGAFGLNGSITLSAKSEAVIDDPVEFVRNTDFVIDSIREIDDKTGGKLEGVLDKVTGSFSKLSNKLKDFLKE